MLQTMKRIGTGPLLLTLIGACAGRRSDVMIDPNRGYSVLN
jgi:hypothetical protein